MKTQQPFHHAHLAAGLVYREPVEPAPRVRTRRGDFSHPAPPPARRAFTLVELLVVVAILTTLVALLLPSLSRARGLSQVVACSSNMRQVALAALAYRSDNTMVEFFWRFANGSADYPQESVSTGGRPGNPARALHTRNGVKQGYLDTGKVFFCPSVDLSYETNYDPDSNMDFTTFWGSYSWHYRPVRAGQDPNPSLNSVTGSDITFQNPTQTKNVVMVDTTTAIYGLQPLFIWGPRFEHYNVLFDDSSVRLMANTAQEFGEFMWGSVGRPR